VEPAPAGLRPGLARRQRKSSRFRAQGGLDSNP